MEQIARGATTQRRRSARTLPADVKHLSWAADELGIGVSTAYRLAASGQLPGAFKVGGQWRVSVPRFLALVHGNDGDEGGYPTVPDVRE